MTTLPDDDNRVVRVIFSDAPATKVMDVDCVVDISGLGSIVGLEILRFQGSTETLAPRPIDPDCYPRWSYDPEVDVLYVNLRDERSFDQVVGRATVGIGRHGGLVTIEARVSS